MDGLKTEAALLGAAIAVVASCSTAPVPGEYVALEAGRRWTYEVFEGEQSRRIAMIAVDGDVRELDGRRTDYDFVFGTLDTMDHMGTKSIYAMPATGPREFYFDGWDWRLGHEPPVVLVSRGDREWNWEGTLEFDDFEGPARATLRMDGPVSVVVPAGAFDAYRIRAIYEPCDLAITRWFVRGVGLVRMDVKSDGIDRGVRLLAWQDAAAPAP